MTRSLLLAACVIALLAVGVAISITHARPRPPVAIYGLLQRQQSLPVSTLRALQDLRLAAAVELAYFSSHGRYAPMEQLKSDGYLDPLWPRSDPASYQVSCSPESERLGFVCYADPVSRSSPYLRVDATQIVRHARERRPAADGAAFP